MVAHPRELTRIYLIRSQHLTHGQNVWSMGKVCWTHKILSWYPRTAFTCRNPSAYID